MITLGILFCFVLFLDPPNFRKEAWNSLSLCHGSNSISSSSFPKSRISFEWMLLCVSIAFSVLHKKRCFSHIKFVSEFPQLWAREYEYPFKSTFNTTWRWLFSQWIKDAKHTECHPETELQQSVKQKHVLINSTTEGNFKNPPLFHIKGWKI